MKKFFATIAKWLDKWMKICQILAGVGLSVIIILYIICVVSGWVQNFIPKYSIISTVSENDSLAVYEYFDKRGYINVNNNEVVISARKNDYEKAWLFSEGLAAVMKDGKIGFINAANEVVIPFEFHCSSQYSCYKFKNGHCVVSNKDGQLGVIDTSGRWVLEPMFDEIKSPCKGNGYRVVVKNNIYGVYDSLWNVVYPTEYNRIHVLPDCVFLAKEGKKWQVDLDGNIVQSFLYDGSESLMYPVGVDESGEVRYELSDYVKYRVIERYGVMNRITGKIVIPAIYEDVNMLSKELFEVQCTRNHDWFMVDKNGNIVK